jgi:NitT/TauT family transport system substrate-binding protein
MLPTLFKSKHYLCYVYLISVLVIFASACSSLSTPTATPVDQTSIQFSWIPTSEFAGFYEAANSGYYTEENLEVSFHEGGFDEDGNFIDSIVRVTNGDADFGITDGGALLVARAGGASIIAIAAIYQRSPVSFVSLAENNIIQPSDLVGKTVALDPAGSGSTFQALLASQGIDSAQVNVIPRTDPTLAPLLTGEADVIDGWVTNEAVLLTLGGYEFNTLLITDYGINIYPNVIFTTEEMIVNNPDLTERFLRATLRGIENTVIHPEDAARLVIIQNPERTLEVETESMLTSIPLLNPVGSRLGLMHSETWEITHRIFVEQGILSEPIDLNAAYTLDFLDRINEASPSD